MLNTRNPCQALNPYNNINVSEISLLAIAKRKSKPEYRAKKNQHNLTADNCLGKRERDREREREREKERERKRARERGAQQIIGVADVIIIAMVNVG